MELLKQGQQWMIKYFLIILLLIGCAADKKHSKRWITSLETLPRVEGLHTIDPKEYQERMKQFEQGVFWPSEDHEVDEEK